MEQYLREASLTGLFYVERNLPYKTNASHDLDVRMAIMEGILPTWSEFGLSA